MALASQKIPSAYSRRSYRGRPSILPKVGAVVGVAAVVGAAWLLRPTDAGSPDARRAGGPGAEVPQIPMFVPPSEGITRIDADTPPVDPAAMALGADLPAADDRVLTPPADAPSQPTPPAPRGNGFDGTTPAPVAPPAGDSAADDASPLAQLTRGLAVAASDPLVARRLLSRALLSGALPPMESAQASQALVRIGEQLVFTPSMHPSDECFVAYTVQSGDSLARIVERQKVSCDWRLIARINNLKRPEAISVGKRLKLPKGPISAVVTKRDYRLDLVMFTGDERVVLTSLPVGLGAANGTPLGRFQVRPKSKLLNPEWRHPSTGEFFGANDPMNPIGEHWLGLEGLDPSNAALEGYGIHGTIEPDSIGHDRSLGCVRLLADDVAIVWESLRDGAEVVIR